MDNVKKLFEVKKQILEAKESLNELSKLARADIKEDIQKLIELFDKHNKIFENKGHSYNDSNSHKSAIMMSIIRNSLKLKNGEYFPITLKIEGDAYSKEKIFYLKDKNIYSLNSVKKSKNDYWAWDYIKKYKDQFLEQVYPKCDEETKKNLDLFLRYNSQETDNSDILIHNFDNQEIKERWDYEDNKSERLSKIVLDNHTFKVTFDNNDYEALSNLKSIEELNVTWIHLFYLYRTELLDFIKEATEKLENGYNEIISLREEYDLMILPYTMGEAL